MMAAQGARSGRARWRAAAAPALGALVLALALVLAFAPAAAAQQPPSAQPLALQEALVEEQAAGEDWLRLRFVAPRIGEGGVSYAEALDDMEFLCRVVGLPVAARSGRPIVRIVVSLSQRETVFGESHPEVTQFFESFRLSEDGCIREDAP